MTHASRHIQSIERAMSVLESIAAAGGEVWLAGLSVNWA